MSVALTEPRDSNGIYEPLIERIRAVAKSPDLIHAADWFTYDEVARMAMYILEAETNKPGV